jgi:hypothetical protein
MCKIGHRHAFSEFLEVDRIKTRSVAVILENRRIGFSSSGNRSIGYVCCTLIFRLSIFHSHTFASMSALSFPRDVFVFIEARSLTPK